MLLTTRPDLVWQYCQRLKKEYPTGSKIYVASSVRLNNRPAAPLIKSDYDMAKAEWHWFKHEEWIDGFSGW